MGYCKRSFEEIKFSSEVKEGMKIIRQLRAGWLDGIGAVKRLVEIGVPTDKAHQIVGIAVNG